MCVVGKLREFNADVDNSVKLPESFLNDLPDIVSGKTFTNDHLQAFHTALKWPAGVSLSFPRSFAELP